MPSDTSLPGALGWIFWYVSELATKWVPGIVVSMTGAQDPSNSIIPTAPPLITSPVTVVDVVHFLQTSSAPGVYDSLYQNWEILIGVSVLISLISGASLIYSMTRVFQIRRTEYKHFEAMTHTVTAHDVPQTVLRWQHILEESRSDSDQSRRLAILEADIMLGELLDELGLRGATMADKMKTVDRGRFNTIDLAWEAHRARNRVAHEAGHSSSGQETRRIIGLYEKVFREFKFVD